MHQATQKLRRSIAAIASAILLVALPTTVSAEQTQGKRCSAGAALYLPEIDCPGWGTCTLSISASFASSKANCGGCCVFGTATMTCPGTSVSENFTICAACGESKYKLVNCPSGPPGSGGFVTMVCTNCPD